MNWWKALKVAWTIVQVVKPVKHNEKVDEVIKVIEEQVATLKEAEKK